jgi:cob(I)alamin adenosyltransferase
MKYDVEKDKFSRGYLQVYTGNGKGKTTASMGLALRALGAGMQVYFAQFLKYGDYSETNALRTFSNLTLRQYGIGGFVMREPSEEDKAEAAKGVAEAREALRGGNYDLVILDEANVACSLKLIGKDDLMSLVSERQEGTELVITGRNAPPELIEAADLVTEMREIKHYFAAGVKARKGIES